MYCLGVLLLSSEGRGSVETDVKGDLNFFALVFFVRYIFLLNE